MRHWHIIYCESFAVAEKGESTRTSTVYTKYNNNRLENCCHIVISLTSHK